MTATPRQANAPTAKTPWQTRLIGLAVLVAFLWLVEIIDQLVLDGSMDVHGIHPRTAQGLWGILVAPFLHGGFGHLLGNTVPLLVLGSLVLVRGLRSFLFVAVLVALVGGFGVWLTGGSNTVHIGASGVIFGFFGFLVFVGILERRVVSLLVSVLVAFFYGGMIWGVLPTNPYISWQGHLFGFLAGLLAAWLTAGRQHRKARRA